MASRIGDIVEKITEYIHIKTEQVKLKLIGYISKILANVLALCFTLLVGFFFLFFLSLGIGALLNEVLGSSFWGYLIIAGFYLLSIIIMLLLVKSGKIQHWLEHLILKIAEQQDEQD